MMPLLVVCYFFNTISALIFKTIATTSRAEINISDVSHASMTSQVTQSLVSIAGMMMQASSMQSVQGD